MLFCSCLLHRGTTANRYLYKFLFQILFNFLKKIKFYIYEIVARLFNLWLVFNTLIKSIWNLIGQNDINGIIFCFLNRTLLCFILFCFIFCTNCFRQHVIYPSIISLIIKRDKFIYIVSVIKSTLPSLHIYCYCNNCCNTCCDTCINASSILASKIIFKTLAQASRYKTMTISKCLLMERASKITWHIAKVIDWHFLPRER